MDEAKIEINGVTLSNGQAMALRVACTSFMAEMAEPNALGDDERGRALAQLYAQRLHEVTLLLAGRRALESDERKEKR